MTSIDRVPGNADTTSKPGVFRHSQSDLLSRTGQDTDVSTQPIWQPEISSGVPALDKLHYDFFQALDALSSASDHEFGARYQAFVAQAEQIFGQEEQWMEDSEFPLTRSHREQHARVLGALHRLHRQVMDGDLEPGREAIDNLLPQWFAFHISTMDTALAYTMQMKIAQTAASSTVERESAAGALQL